MKKKYFLVLTLCFFNFLSAQVIDFPDAKFKAMLLTSQTYTDIAWDLDGKKIKIDANNNGEIEVSEAEKVARLELTAPTEAKKISSLIGILNFKNIKNIRIQNALLTNLDLGGLTSLEYLECDSNDKLTSITLQGLTNLKNLDLYGCRVTSLNLNGLTSLETLDCTANPLTTLNVSNLFNLKSLLCSYTNINSLSIIDLKSLNKIDCSNNPITSLTLTGLDGLKDFNCDYTQMSSLNLSNLTGLETLSARYCKLTSLSLLNLSNLKELACGYNQLTKLNIKNSNNLVGLGCYNNNISELDLSNFNSLKWLICNNNMLSSLKLNNLLQLEELICGFNQLTELDVSSLKKLQFLSCYNNQINALDVSNSRELIELRCFDNKITSLDANNLPKLLKLDCYNNNLSHLFIKNGIAEGRQLNSTFNIYNNPNLKYICADDIDIEYIKEVLQYNNMLETNINTYCSFVPGGTFYTIEAYNKFDINNNGCDQTDVIVPSIKYNITSLTNSGSLVGDNFGKSSIKLQSGTYKITPVLENQSYFNITPSEATISLPADTNPLVQNFCITAIANKTDLDVVLIPETSARPGFEARYNITYKNKGNTIQSGSVNLKFDDSILNYSSSNTTLSDQKTDNINWSFTNLMPFESREIKLVLNLNRPTETPPVNNGDILKFTATIISQGSDETPPDNTFVLNQTVVGSLDPNDKTCLEGDVITPSLIGEYVHYLIRFENTGTYAAQNIVVKDMIDLTKFDISTLIPTSSSHSFVTKISEGNKVEFIFENINLPFDDANNDGYIAFKIKTKPTLAVGDTFTNDANIYFDYNFPILTNKATSTFKTLGTQDFEFSNYFKLYPIPSNNILNISATQSIEMQSLAIYDILGQLVIAIPNAKSVSNIDVSKLRTGNYFIKVKSDKGSSSMKFIKL